MFFGPQVIKHSLAIASIALLVGCQTIGTQMENWSNVPKSKQVKVSQIDESHDVIFTTASAELTSTERKRLRAFLTKSEAARQDKFYLVSGKVNIPASLSGSRKTIIADYLASFGINTENLSGDPAKKLTPGETVTLFVRRHVVVLPGCPDWSGERFTYNNTPTSNFGCATATNLGLMVARPGDLIQGRSMGHADGEYTATSINRYRKGETTPISPEDVGITQSQQKTGGGQ